MAHQDVNLSLILCLILALFVIISYLTATTDLTTFFLAITIIFSPFFIVLLILACSPFTQQTLRPTFNGQPLQEV